MYVFAHLGRKALNKQPQKEFRLNNGKMTGEINGLDHGGLGGVCNIAHGAGPNIKKAGRSPRVREGPAKNLLNRRQRNAQQDTTTLSSFAG